MCSVFAVWCSLCDVRRLSPLIAVCCLRCLLFVDVCSLLFAVSFVVCCLVVDVCGLLVAVVCDLSVVVVFVVR